MKKPLYPKCKCGNEADYVRWGGGVPITLEVASKMNHKGGEYICLDCRHEIMNVWKQVGDKRYAFSHKRE